MLLYQTVLSRLSSLPCSIGIGLGILLAASPAPVAAQVVYDGGAPIQENAILSDFGTPMVRAETFTFGSLTSFNSVEWYGAYAPTNTAPVTDNFTITFFDTTAGVPNETPIAGLTFNVGNNVNRTATGLTVVVYTEYAYSSTLPGGVSLPAGTYAISIVNNTAGDTDDDWYWETTNPRTGGQHFIRFLAGGAWDDRNQSLSFRLVNVAAAPEPGSLALLSLAALPLIGAFIRRRRPA